MIKRFLDWLNGTAPDYSDTREEKDSNQFQLKYVRWDTLGHGDYYKSTYYVMYSINGGRTWKHIYECITGGHDEDWKWFEMFRNVHRTPFKNIKEMFPDYQSILNYEAKEKKRLHRLNQERRKSQREYETRLSKLYNED